MVGRKLGPWSEFPFLYRLTVLLNSGGSDSPWSEFWSEFPHFMGMEVVPAPSNSSPVSDFSTNILFTAIFGLRGRLIIMAKASFSAYVLVKSLLKTGEKVQFSTKKSTTNFGHPFCFFPFPFFASKWLKYAVFAFQKGKNVGRKRGLRHNYVRHTYGVANADLAKLVRKQICRLQTQLP